MTAELDRIRDSIAPARTTQATAVEQSRAVAEVHGAIVVAQQCPRNEARAWDKMRDICRTKGMADKAFYTVPNRGNGPTVHLARALAAIWGNFQYGVDELSRDDDLGMSEVRAWAWDVETNARSSRTFQVPHARMKGRERQKLTDLGDIYSNNQNQGARAVREAIFSLLPPGLVEEAKDTCHRTLQDGGGKPIAQRITEAIRAFDGLGVTLGQLEERQGKTSDKWTEVDVANLGILYGSIQRGETTKDEEFPTAQVTAAEIVGKRPARKPEPVPAADPGDYDPTGEPGWQPDGAA